jgi:hypothetical protein
MIIGESAIAANRGCGSLSQRRKTLVSMWSCAAWSGLGATFHVGTFSQRENGMKFAVLAAAAAIGIAAFANMAAADNDELKCTSKAQSAWMSQDATKDLLKQQGYQEVRKIKVTEGNCYEVYAIDAQGEKVEVYLDPTSGNLVAKED